MAAELNMYHAQLNDYKAEWQKHGKTWKSIAKISILGEIRLSFQDEIERVTKELQDTKRRQDDAH